MRYFVDIITSPHQYLRKPMNEFNTAMRKAIELECRVRDLYYEALRSDAGIVTLRLLFSDINLPKRGVKYFKGELAVAIARVVVPSHTHYEWTVWLTRKSKGKGNFNFKIKVFDAISMPGCENVPWEFSTGHYFVYSYPGDLPFN
jgi:hypothetical protein